MPTFSPELINTMNAVLEEAMTMVPLEKATTGVKAYLAECILKAAAQGVTSYDSLMAGGGKPIADHPLDVLLIQKAMHKC